MTDRLASNSSSSMKSAAAASEAKAYALRFISGKYQGGEFPVEEMQQVIIGRSSDLDMVLVEELVSRRHAKIEFKDGVVSIEDMGSTNGTFVNGEKVQRADLKEGDRVLIGTSILKLITVDRPPDVSGSSAKRPAVKKRLKLEANEAPRMTGNLEEVPLPDLLQLFGTSKKNGVLVLRTESDTARVHLKDGRICYAELEALPQLAPAKAVYRILGWSHGMFELDPPDERTFPTTIDLSAQEVLMEGFRQMDELKALSHKLPAPGVGLCMPRPLGPKLSALTPAHLELVQLAHNAPDFQTLLDASPLSDLDVVQGTLELLKSGYLEPSG
jgi:pSer/pThr/pTyr-binding forkhead associated (FHA) protein